MRIAQALPAKGIALLRFYFTGLDNSGGDFANSNISCNIHDLSSAAKYMEDRFGAPEF